MAIVKWDPVRDLSRIFDDDFDMFPAMRNFPRNFLVDVFEEGGSVIAEMSIAGMDPKKIHVTIEENYLRVTGETEKSEEEKKKNYYYREIQRGSFERTVRLPDGVKSEGSKATYENGVLQVTMPIADTGKKQRKIPIEVKKK